MAKVKLNDMSEEQLNTYKEQLLHEIDTLEKVVEVSNTTVFELLIDEVKKDMKDNVAEENWKVLKTNQKKIETYKNVKAVLQNQEKLLETKKEELESVEDKLKYQQQNIFNQQQEEEKPEHTGFDLNDGNGVSLEIRTGDVYEIHDDDPLAKYVLVKKSVDIAGSYAMISNYFEGERCLQYPSNFKILDNASFVGNIYEDSEDEFLADCLNKIADYQDPPKENNSDDNGETKVFSTVS